MLAKPNYMPNKHLEYLNHLKKNLYKFQLLGKKCIKN